MRYAFILVSLCGSVEASERASYANYFTVCRNACGDFDPQNFVGDGSCDDGGPGSETDMCPLGSHPRAAELLKTYDDSPDGRMQLEEFKALVKDLESGVVRMELSA